MNRDGHYMQTYTGKLYWPTDPSPDDVCIEDIAHHLSMLCRYTGATKYFYSVAEHSVLVSHMVSRENALAGLLHDATEAYLNDINRPLKYSPGMEGYRTIELLNWHVIARKFDLPVILPKEVHQADNDILFHEMKALMPPPPNRTDWGMGLVPPGHLQPNMIHGCDWSTAKHMFMKRYEELTS